MENGGIIIQGNGLKAIALDIVEHLGEKRVCPLTQVEYRDERIELDEQTLKVDRVVLYPAIVEIMNVNFSIEGER